MRLSSLHNWLMVIFDPPLNDVSFIVLAVCRVEAVDAFPVSAAVMVPAEKFPLPSRATIALAVFAPVSYTHLTLPTKRIV